MPPAAQTTRAYDDCLKQLAAGDAADFGYHAVSIVGPRNSVDKLVGKLALLP